MDTRLLRYYERELQHLRETGGEFAREFPKIAGRLGLETTACADPYVERLLEGFSFLAARVQLKIDAEFPRFTDHLLELVYPQYLAPTPSMAVVRLQPDLADPALAQGVTVPRDTALRSLLGKDDQTACEFRTAHDVTLWPLTLAEADYFTWSGAQAGIDTSRFGEVKAALRLRLACSAGLRMQQLALDTLTLHLAGSDALPHGLLQHLLTDAVGMVALPSRQPPAWQQPIERRHITHPGFAATQALLPCGARSFQGYRLLHEYFTFPQRFLFVALGGLAGAVQRCADTELDLLILFKRAEPVLEQTLSGANFSLFCTPAINLFPKRADRIHISERESEFHLVPDRTRPMDYEVCAVRSVTGYGAGADALQAFQPFYSANDLQAGQGQQAYFQIRRAPRLFSPRQQREGARSSYLGSEVFLSLVDALEAPYRSDLRQLGVDTLCSNRDLVLSMPLGSGKTDFHLDSGAPVQSVRCVAGPTVPLPSHAHGETAWRLVSHLSLNYLSLRDTEGGEGAAALRDLLHLYCPRHDLAMQRQVEGLRAVHAEPITRRLPMPGPGPVSWARGLHVTVTFDESAFEGAGVFLLGAVLEQFFARHVALNSFTETSIATLQRGHLVTWPPRIGRCEIL